jgi:hypothetical protein
MLNIISHRGYWLDPKEKNTKIAFSRALSYGFGIETDFRDLNGQLVVSHDIPLIGAMDAREFVDLYKACPVNAPLALNIKADGLQELLSQFIQAAGFNNSFVFDMPVPDMRAYIGLKIPIYTRQSEYEVIPVLLSSCQGVWLDAFESTWYDLGAINPILAQGKGVAIVSPELHGRSHLELWQWLKMNKLHEQSLVSLCTDFPLQAQEFFNAKN